MSSNRERDVEQVVVPDKNASHKKAFQRGKTSEGKIMASTTVQKWGNSLAVRIPAAIAEATAIKQGVELLLAVNEEGIQLIPKKKKPTLDELLSKITPENKHAEIDFGITGNELI